MSKRKTVTIKHKNIIDKISENGWSASTFSKKVGKYRTWISEVSRGKNLPSPEEAAMMCAILQVTPEEILTEPEDIALVQGLIDSQKPEQKEKSDLHQETGLSPAKQEAWNLIQKMDDETLKRFIAAAKAMLGE